MRLTILQGDVFKRMAELPNDSIDLCITSPPYWGLRSYGAGEAELGREPTMEKYLDNTLRWVKEVYRVLKPTGSFVLNIGDCFIGGGRGAKPGPASLNYNHAEAMQPPDWSTLKANSTPTSYACGDLGGIYKTKQLLSVSSFAYCRIVSETDFVMRNEMIWCKSNVPSPIRCRLKHSHEKLFWFVKDADEYYFDEKPWMKKTSLSSKERMKYNKTAPAFADNIGLSPTSGLRSNKPRNKAYGEDQSTMQGKRGCGMSNEETIEHSWRIIPVGEKQQGFEMEEKKPISEHIAPFPTNLIEPYIKSLCPSNGVVLDPFLGSGTTIRVAMENMRDAVGIELNEKYVKYAKKRLNWGHGLDVEYIG